MDADDDTPLHRLRDGTTGTTLEALAEAQREVEARDVRIEVLEAEKAALERQVAAEQAAFQRESREHAETANKLDDWRDRYATIAAGLREALDLCSDAIAYKDSYLVQKHEDREEVARLRKLLPESFHPTAQAPVTTGESAPGIVSPVATEDSGATVKEPAP